MDRRLSIDSPNTYINQFPGEHVITVKDYLASLAASIAKETYLQQSNDLMHGNDDTDAKLSTNWYPVTFNLVYELPQFCAYFQSNYVSLLFFQLNTLICLISSHFSSEGY